jgi:2-iminobutanoate/2-iminopropanoate deaminase
MPHTPKQIRTDRAPTPGGFYSQAVQAGNLVFISGQLPFDCQRHIVGHTPGQQARQALKNVQAILEAAGGQLADLVSVTIYVSDMDYWSEVNAVYGDFMSSVEIKPARAVVPVNKLNLGAMIEIQAIACLEPKS